MPYIEPCHGMPKQKFESSKTVDAWLALLMGILIGILIGVFGCQ